MESARQAATERFRATEHSSPPCSRGSSRLRAHSAPCELRVGAAADLRPAFDFDTLPWTEHQAYACVSRDQEKSSESSVVSNSCCVTMVGRSRSGVSCVCRGSFFRELGEQAVLACLEPLRNANAARYRSPRQLTVVVRGERVTCAKKHWTYWKLQCLREKKKGGKYVVRVDAVVETNPG